MTQESKKHLQKCSQNDIILLDCVQVHVGTLSQLIVRLQVPATAHSRLQEDCHPNCKCSYSREPG